MTTTTTGITHLQDLASFVCAVGDAVGKSLADGKVDATDLANLIPAMLAAPKAFMSLGLVGDEYFDLDDSEKKVLFTQIQTDLDIPQKTAETIAETIIKIAIDFNSVVAAVVGATKTA